MQTPQNGNDQDSLLDFLVFFVNESALSRKALYKSSPLLLRSCDTK